VVACAHMVLSCGQIKSIRKFQFFEYEYSDLVPFLVRKIIVQMS